MKTRVILTRWGAEGEDAVEFGYFVTGHPEHGYSYKNRGSLLRDSFLLRGSLGIYSMEERSRGVVSYSEIPFDVDKGEVAPEGFKAVNLELYKRARTFAESLVEKLTPEFVDDTPIGMKARGEIK